MVKCSEYKICEKATSHKLLSKRELALCLGAHIVKLRKERGWTQSELARRCDKDRQAIERIENGKLLPGLYTLYEIANALEVDLCIMGNFCY